ncbi:hypothetical protein CMV_024498 [Castanea mollissima]|uniref:Uncharacterized protein n=1 Tax=Castanea mollissima TaxID=60419 RepID=A0A8J4V9K5_9ROSI|nr:hypothetical protein CMV_024498 [Castanea mollissima]
MRRGQTLKELPPELFQGKAKGFDVEKALLAKSVRDFDKAISMVSLHETWFGNVKIPVLFIQKELLAWPPAHDWLPKRTVCIMALRLIKMQRHSVAICQLFHYKGHLDPQKRDALNKAV